MTCTELSDANRKLALEFLGEADLADRVADRRSADAATRAVRFTAILAASSDFQTVIIPIRDGLAIAQRR